MIILSIFFFVMDSVIVHINKYLYRITLVCQRLHLAFQRRIYKFIIVLVKVLMKMYVLFRNIIKLDLICFPLEMRKSCSV